MDYLLCPFFVLSQKERAGRGAGGGSDQEEPASCVAGCAHWVTKNRNDQPPCGGLQCVFDEYYGTTSTVSSSTLQKWPWETDGVTEPNGTQQSLPGMLMGGHTSVAGVLKKMWSVPIHEKKVNIKIGR